MKNEPMPLITVAYAVLLLILGIGAFAMTSAPTSLIPASFGVIFLVLGLLAFREKLLKHAMHVAAMFTLIALLGTAKGAWYAVLLIAGTEVARPQAAIAQGIMFLLSVAFLMLCINSFIQTRRRREAAARGGSSQ